VEERGDCLLFKQGEETDETNVMKIVVVVESSL
jgi:hypothetical protein